jgi:hypothetical protein
VWWCSERQENGVAFVQPFCLEFTGYFIAMGTLESFKCDRSDVLTSNITFCNEHRRLRVFINNSRSSSDVTSEFPKEMEC